MATLLTRTQSNDPILNRVQDMVEVALRALLELVKQGTRTDDSAAKGEIGELLEASAADGSVTGWASFTPKNIAALTLTPGEWDVEGVGMFAGGAVTGTNVLVGISKVSQNFDSGDFCNENYTVPQAGISIRLPTPTRPIKVKAGTTQVIYLVSRITFSAGGPPTAGGRISARRVR